MDDFERLMGIRGCLGCLGMGLDFVRDQSIYGRMSRPDSAIFGSFRLLVYIIAIITTIKFSEHIRTTCSVLSTFYSRFVLFVF